MVRRIVLKLFCVAAIVLSTYLFSALVLIFNPLFYAEIGADSETAKELTTQFVDYLRSPSFAAAQIPRLTEKENSHLLDVKKIIFGLQILLLLMLLMLVVLHNHVMLKVLLYSGIAIFLLPLLLYILPFDALFLQFHYTFFPQGNWQFDAATTTLVNIYPEEFFMKFFARIVVHGWMIGSVVLYTLNKRKRIFRFKHTFSITAKV